MDFFTFHPKTHQRLFFSFAAEKTEPSGLDQFLDGSLFFTLLVFLAMRLKTFIVQSDAS